MFEDKFLYPPNGTTTLLNGKPLICCLGCSHTLGYTPLSFSYPAQLEVILGTYQIINCGVHNKGLRPLTEFYNTYLTRLKPKLLILQIPLFCRQPFPSLQDDLNPQHYTMTDGAYSILNNHTVSEGQFLSVAGQLIMNDTNRLRSFVANLDTNVLIVLFKASPLRFWFMDHLVSIHHQEIERAMKLFGVHVVTGMSVSYFRKNNMLLEDNAHLNTQGNAFLATKIYESMEHHQIVVVKNSRQILLS